MSRWIIAACVLCTLISCSPPPPKKVAQPKQYVVASANGKVVRQGWEEQAPEYRYERDGLDNLTPFIDKLLASKNWFSSVTVISLDESQVIPIWKMEGVIKVGGFF